MSDLSPTVPRPRITRLRERGRSDREELLAFLGEALIAHVAVDAGGHPVALPVAFGVDPDGPDEDGTIYLHGSVGAGWMRHAPGSTVCVTVTSLDGLVLARSGFHHSMNYRCAVVIGTARLVESEEERARALDLVVDQIVPGRAATLRPHTRKELVATAVLAVPLHEASLKLRDRGRRRRARGRRGRDLGGRAAAAHGRRRPRGRPAHVRHPCRTTSLVGRPSCADRRCQ